MEKGYKILGNYIRLVDERNKNLAVTKLLGVSISKKFIPSIANIVGTDLSNYKIVRTGQFAYGPVTSRNGEKISIAYLDEEDCIISSSYTVFEVENKEELDPEYLMLWFSRPEFDRYARYKSHGSVREIFDWNELCMVELPVPDIEKQRKIVKAYKTITDRIDLKQKINDNLVATLQIIYKKMFLESQNTYITKPLADLCSKIGSGATPKGGKAAYFDKGISLIRSMNVFDYFFSYPELAHISQIQANALANVEIQQADVLFNITGVSVTRCCVVPDDVLPARVNQHVMIIRPYKGKNMSYYIMCTLCTSENKAKLLGIGQSGSTREAINKQELERFEIPVPSDEELERFGEIATKIYALIFSNTNEIRMLCDMKDTLLTKLSSY
ncbi:restriction endonuclease subunit S [[Ruminococcus] torques]|uniref:restriction endonuclease subunit S n=1 Tax=[Ruminococcus] torques TaxID=33039 RepID=UPI001D08AF43|nr:restriction endonuclease subunit S [[Ruminococcus] torques]MCB6638801.1 restriction endonuclease subunit S [[Ruminococcus] torques]